MQQLPFTRAITFGKSKIQHMQHIETVNTHTVLTFVRVIVMGTREMSSGEDSSLSTSSSGSSSADVLAKTSTLGMPVLVSAA
jgi:hypothetical protein